LEIFDAIINTSSSDSLQFNLPPYEYEYKLMPFDILSGDSGMRETLVLRASIKIEKERWLNEISEFRNEFLKIAVYSE
jgi:hypothetical protein